MWGPIWARESGTKHPNAKWNAGVFFHSDTMMQAGDVQLNPGPSCSLCELTIMAKHKPMSFVTYGAAAHGSCTGLSKARRERNEPYTCHQCGGVPDDERCGLCGRTFTMNAKRFRCNCGTEVHCWL